LWATIERESSERRSTRKVRYWITL
jgi:hypothetical protein